MSLQSAYQEKEVLQRVVEGDENAFAVLYRHYARKVFPFLVKLTGSENAAEDVIQNTFLSLWLNRVRLQEIDNISGYIFRTAGNHAYNWLAKNKSMQKHEAIAASHAPSPQDFTSQEILFREAQKIISEIVDDLPGQRRKIYKLYREERLSYNEIAEQLNISPSTVRNAVASALESIREKLRESGLYIFFILFFGSR
ncbi:MAG: RNA polymerase sigma-70 factor [Chitinophagaceae bacterium]|nr:RNA polymerase sigma-70 factor [Chitinophagaceae bacterium]